MQRSERGVLTQQQARVRPKREEISRELPFEIVAQSPLANEQAPPGLTIIARSDRYGFPIRLGLCHQSGLLFLIDRLTLEGYRRFYEMGLYRELVQIFWGNEAQNTPDLGAVHIEKLIANDEGGAQAFIQALDGLIDLPAGAGVLDIGGSTGATAQVLQEKYGCHATVLEPSNIERQIATERGLKTIAGLFEEVTFSAEEKYDLIILNKTVEHLIHIDQDFAKIHALLKPGGLFIFDFLDFIQEVEMRGAAMAVSRLDHCFFLFNEMVDIFCGRLGFVIEKRIHHHRLSVLLVCRRDTPQPHLLFDRNERLQFERRMADKAVQWSKTPEILAYSLEEKFKRRLKIEASN